MSSVAIVHTFVVGAHDEDDAGVVLRITASAGYRAGLVPTDPVLARAAAFAARPSTPTAVYIACGRDEPTRWTRFADVVALPATDGSPTLRFRALGSGRLATAFLDAAMRTRQILTVDLDPGPGNPTIILFTPEQAGAGGRPSGPGTAERGLRRRGR